MLLLISPFTFYYFYNLEIRTIICKWRLIHLKLFYCRLYFTAFTTVSIRIYYLYLYLCWTRRLIYNIVLYVRQYFLEANGIPLSQIIYVNFEDERLLEMTAEDLNLILEIGLEISGTDIKPYLFLDEIQNINGWEKSFAELQNLSQNLYRITDWLIY